MNSNLETIDANFKALNAHLKQKSIKPDLLNLSNKIISKINKSKRYESYERIFTIIGVVLLIVGLYILFFSKEDFHLTLMYSSRIFALMVCKRCINFL